MRVLALTDQARWLRAHELPADPYESGGDTFKYYLQFHPPKHLAGIECFTGALIGCAAAGGEAMLTVMDTECPYDYDERLFDRLRFPAAGPGTIHEAPAHLFGADELQDLIPMFGLTAAWQWETYLHMPGTRTILLNWEGDVFDLWTDDPSVFVAVSEMLRGFGLSETDPPGRPRASEGGPPTPRDDPGARREPPPAG